jgi:hypothetical protein
MAGLGWAWAGAAPGHIADNPRAQAAAASAAPWRR